jgi:hypothetical protein
MAVNFDFSHGAVDLLELQPLERYLLGDEEIDSLVLNHEVDLACVSECLP